MQKCADEEKSVSLQQRRGWQAEASVQTGLAQGQLQCLAWDPLEEAFDTAFHEPPGSIQQICLNPSVKVFSPKCET